MPFFLISNWLIRTRASSGNEEKELKAQVKTESARLNLLTKETIENLTDAQNGEDYEITTMYPPMLAEAETEGDKKAARSMHFALEVEKVHYELYGQAIAAVTDGKDLKDAKVRVCPICGHTVIGDAPDNCPVCGCIGSRYLEIA